MKKSCTRVLSLLLVLIMLIGVMPMAFAEEISDFGAGAVTATPSSNTVQAGKSVTLTASVPYDSKQFGAPKVEWRMEDNGIGTIKKDSSNPFKATFTPNLLDELNNFEVSVIMIATCKELESGASLSVIKPVTITVEVSDAAPNLPPDDDYVEDEEIRYTVKVEPSELKLAVGETSNALKVTVTKRENGKETAVSASGYDVEWLAAKKDGKEIVSVDDAGKVTGVAEGKVKVEAIVILKGEDIERVAVCDVTVGSPADDEEGGSEGNEEDKDGNMQTTVSLNLSSRGFVMGEANSSAVAAAYKKNTGKELGYVIFDLPNVLHGRLYSHLPSERKNVHGTSMTLNYVAEGTLLGENEKCAYGGGLEQVAFIPAAGFRGMVTLTYEAFDATGGNRYEGKLRFNVAARKASAVFDDVNASRYSWASDSADFLFYEGVAQGSKAAGSDIIKYNPAAKITRQDFMLMLYRAFLAKDYGTFNVTANFPDVVKGTSDYTREIYQAVGVAKHLGIAQGTNDVFNPKSNITRQEAMVLIYRTLNVMQKELEYSTATNIAAFRDYNKISSWATDAISYLVNHGVIQGSNEMINPSANITRAEMACILHRVLTY